jgi:transcriptional regulator with XRE-family HTH domain
MGSKAASATAAHLAVAIQQSGKTQNTIANEAGLPRSNALSMMKRGSCKVPIERIPALAEACGVPSLPFLDTALREYQPELQKVLETVAGGYLTAGELEWLRIYRVWVGQEREIDHEVRLEIHQHLEQLFARQRS